MKPLHNMLVNLYDALEQDVDCITPSWLQNASAMLQAAQRLVSLKNVALYQLEFVEKERDELRKLVDDSLTRRRREKEHEQVAKVPDVSCLGCRNYSPDNLGDVPWSEVDRQKIKEIRERSGAGVSACKVALLKSRGDVDKAVSLIEKTGLA